nr:hypothetical protein [Tanacetum cinerariifolium]
MAAIEVPQTLEYRGDQLNIAPVLEMEIFTNWKKGVRRDLRDMIPCVSSFCRLFFLPSLFFLHRVSSGSQNAGDAVVSKFDIHVYTFVLTFDEVKNLVAEYAIPLDLHPCVPPSGMSMNRLSIDKIGGKGKIFNEFCTSLKHEKDQFFLIDRCAIPDAMLWRHQDSGVADPALTSVHAEDIHRLCKNVIDLCPVHPSMLYAISLTTIWRHVRHHLVFKDGEGNAAASMSQLFKLSMAEGVRVGKGTTFVASEVIPQHTTLPLPFGSQIPKKSDHQRVVEYENEMVLAAKRIAQAAKDRVVGKRAAIERASQRTKKKIQISNVIYYFKLL